MDVSALCSPHSPTARVRTADFRCLSLGPLPPRSYFLKAIEWARKYGLRINLDLHAVPGSQNGWSAYSFPLPRSALSSGSRL